jgi:hypothetical protein
MILFLIAGVVAFTIGLLSIVSSDFDQYLNKIFPSSKLDKQLLSERNRYIIRRYVSGIRGIVLGILGVAVYVESNEHLRMIVLNWFHAIFGN